jgi:ureidoacrylate peracid hydrolase
MKQKTDLSESQPSTKPASQDADSCLGPVAHNAWTWAASHISLVRRPLEPRPVLLEARPQPIELDIARSALVVIDMQNDFCHPQGWFGQKGVDVAPARAPIPILTNLLPAWRAAGGRVIWLNWGIRADRLNLSPTIHLKGKRSEHGVGYGESSPIDRGPSLVRGAWGAQVIDELGVDAADISIDKHRLSGFWDNEFDTVLRHQAVTTLLFAGINTDRCVFSTLQDAAFLGYDCILLEDACSTSSPAYVTEAIHFMVQELHGFVARADRLNTALPQARSQNPTQTSKELSE